MTVLSYQTPPRAPGTAVRYARILPLAFITYSLAYLDRVNIAFGGAGGMRQTLKLTESQFTWFNSVFFIGYVLFQIPGASYAARRSVRKLMFWALVFWGIIATATALLTNFPLLLLDRFLLGAVEGLVFPSLLVFLTHWFTKGERSKANTFLILGNPLTVMWASLASGALVDCFDRHRVFIPHPHFLDSVFPAAMRGWQMMLLCEGVPTLIWAGLWWFLAKDRPTDAAWLPQDVAAGVESVLEAEQANVKKVRDYKAAFCDPQVILFCILFFAWSIGIYGLNMWLPVIMSSGSSIGLTNIGFLTAIPYLFGAIVMLAVSTVSDRLLVRKPFVWPWLFLGAAAFAFSYVAGPYHFWWSFFGLIVAATCMYAPYGPFWAMVPEMVSRNVIGESLALINTIGAVGGFIGTAGVGKLHDFTGGYGASFACLAIALAAAGGLTLAIRPSLRSGTSGPLVV